MVESVEPKKEEELIMYKKGYYLHSLEIGVP